MIGKATAFSSGTSGGTDDSPPTPADDISSEFYTWDSSIAAKKIASSDVTRAVVRRNFANGTTFDMYRHDYSRSNTASVSGSTNLYNSNFYL